MLRLFAGLVLFAGSALADTAYVGAPLICGTGGMNSKLISPSQRWSSSGGRSGQANFDA